MIKKALDASTFVRNASSGHAAKIYLPSGKPVRIRRSGKVHGAGTPEELRWCQAILVSDLARAEKTGEKPATMNQDPVAAGGALFEPKLIRPGYEGLRLLERAVAGCLDAFWSKFSESDFHDLSYKPTEVENGANQILQAADFEGTVPELEKITWTDYDFRLYGNEPKLRFIPDVKWRDENLRPVSFESTPNITKLT